MAPQSLQTVSLVLCVAAFFFGGVPPICPRWVALDEHSAMVLICFWHLSHLSLSVWHLVRAAISLWPSG